MYLLKVMINLLFHFLRDKPERIIQVAQWATIPHLGASIMFGLNIFWDLFTSHEISPKPGKYLLKTSSFAGETRYKNGYCCNLSYFGTKPPLLPATALASGRSKPSTFPPLLSCPPQWTGGGGGGGGNYI